MKCFSEPFGLGSVIQVCPWGSALASWLLGPMLIEPPWNLKYNVHTQIYFVSPKLVNKAYSFHFQVKLSLSATRFNAVALVWIPGVRCVVIRVTIMFQTHSFRDHFNPVRCCFICFHAFYNGRSSSTLPSYWSFSPEWFWWRQYNTPVICYLLWFIPASWKVEFLCAWQRNQCVKYYQQECDFNYMILMSSHCGWSLKGLSLVSFSLNPWGSCYQSVLVEFSYSRDNKLTAFSAPVILITLLWKIFVEKRIIAFFLVSYPFLCSFLLLANIYLGFHLVFILTPFPL